MDYYYSIVAGNADAASELPVGIDLDKLRPAIRQVNITATRTTDGDEPASKGRSDKLMLINTG